jgi:hypothetical protein
MVEPIARTGQFYAVLITAMRADAMLDLGSDING